MLHRLRSQHRAASSSSPEPTTGETISQMSTLRTRRHAQSYAWRTISARILLTTGSGGVISSTPEQGTARKQGTPLAHVFSIRATERVGSIDWRGPEKNSAHEDGWRYLMNKLHA